MQSYSDEDLSLFVADEPRYDHLILLPSSKKAIGNKKGFNQHQLVEFINREGNIFVVGNDETVLPDDVRTFLNEMGIYPAPKGFKYVDHFNSAKVFHNSQTKTLPIRRFSDNSMGANMRTRVPVR